MFASWAPPPLLGGAAHVVHHPREHLPRVTEKSRISASPTVAPATPHPRSAPPRPRHRPPIRDDCCPPSAVDRFPASLEDESPFHTREVDGHESAVCDAWFCCI